MAKDIASTDMLYMPYEGCWLTECEAKVLHVENLDDGLNVCLDRTVLHAQGGGQPTDKGTIEGNGKTMKVSKVTIDRDTGVASHQGSMQNESSALDVGDTVTVTVDEAERRILSECHTAGHVVDSAMARIGKLFKPTKAYHFLDGPYVEYAGAVPVEERPQALIDLQRAFCQLVDESIDTKIELLSKEEADTVCNRIAKNFDVDVFADARTNQVRVVTVAGFPCPCGGTHVRCTSDLKDRKWGITGFKAKKGVIRVKYGQNVDPVSS